MTRRLILLFTLLVLAVPALAGKPPAAGDVFPEISLPMPEDPAHLRYLGLEGSGGTFRLADVKAQVIIVEMFSIYCPHCQREAPKVNDLFNLIRSKSLDGTVKILGVGPGNSAFEIATFVKKYGIEFPLFPDKEYAAHKLVGETRTPHFFVLRMQEGKAEVSYSQLGSFGDAEAFLETVVRPAR